MTSEDGRWSVWVGVGHSLPSGPAGRQAQTETARRPGRPVSRGTRTLMSRHASAPRGEPPTASTHYVRSCSVFKGFREEPR